MTEFFTSLLRLTRRLLAALPARAAWAVLLLLVPLLGRAQAPVLRLEATVAPATGVDVTAFVDQVQVIDALTGLAIPTAVANAGFETSGPLSNTNYGYNPAGASWTFDTRSGIASNGSPFGNGTAPEGTRVAFLQTASTEAGAFSQPLALVPGRYKVRMRLRQRNTTPANQGVRVLVDGVAVATVTPSTSGYSTLTTLPFRVAARSLSNFFVDGRIQTENFNYPLRVGDTPAPTVADVDGDGKMDMLVGNSGGNLSYFEYDVSGLWVGQSGVGGVSDGFASPTVADLDDNGLIDMLVGAVDGTVRRREQTTPGGSTYKDAGGLTTNGTLPLDVGGQADPVVTDVDGDGLFDLLVGNSDGNIYRFEQTVANGGVFASRGQLTTNGTTIIDVGTNATPTITDLDGDGLLDMLVGEINGAVLRYEQTQANGAAFAEAGTVSLGSNSLQGEALYYANPVVTDLDGDGLLDLLVGSRIGQGSVVRYEQAPPLALRSLSPTSGPLGTVIDLFGEGLTGATSVLIGGVPAPFITYGDYRVLATVPRQAVNQRVRLTGAGGTVLSVETFQVTRPSSRASLLGGSGLTTDGTTVLDARDWAAPAVTDVDGDGLLDMLVGDLGGNLLRYEQTQANGDVFARASNVTSNGNSIINVVSLAAPAVTDVDGDGLLDLLLGSEDGTVARYEQTQANGTTFAPAGLLLDGSGGAVDVGIYSRPTVTDLDGDGLLDVLVGNYNGNILRYEQTQANGSNFAVAGSLTDGAGTALDVGDVAAPTVTDLDGDGLLEVLVGNLNGVVTRYEQLTPNGGAFVVAPLTTNNITLDAGGDAAPVVTDLDGDGLLDVLVGNLAGNILRYEQAAPLPVPTLSSLRPGSGPLGTTLTLAGSGFTGLSSVRVGGVPALFVVQNDGQATATVPRQAVDQRVRISSEGGTGLSADAFRVTRPSASPVVTGGGPLTTNGTALLSVTESASPAVTDVDGDGLLDVLVVDFNGFVTRFEQTTANGDAFASQGPLTSNGTNNLRVGGYAALAVTDVNGDGRLDLLVSNPQGNLARYEQTQVGGTVFTSVGALTTDGTTLLDAGINSAPTVTDLDGDGLLDLLVGNYDGIVRRFEQTTANGSSFALVGDLTTNGTTALAAGINSVPTVTDLDGDGLLELLVGNKDGNIARFEQTQANGGAFAPLGLLTTNGTTLVAGTNARPVVTDVDGDGLLDVLVGNYAGNVLRYEQFRPPAPTLTGLNPGRGPLGTTLTLTGTGFASLTSVQLGGVPATFTVQSATLATAVVPRQAVDQRVRISAPEGIALSATAFQVARPSPSVVFPALGNLTDGATVLDVNTYATPAVTDVDRDGLLDVLVGNDDGFVVRYEQTQANGADFASRGQLTTDGTTLLSIGYKAAPTVTDVDGDGLLDLLVGEYYGNVVRFEQTTPGGNVFAQLGELTTDGTNTLDVGAYSSPVVTDLDSDGLLDLLVGDESGAVTHFEQTQPNEGAFALVGPLTTDGTTALNVGSNAAPSVTDMDGDGRYDLLVSNSAGGVQRFEQTTANGRIFALVAALTTNGSTALSAGTFGAPTVTDVDGDGLLDLLVGNRDGNLTRYEQAAVPALASLSSSAELPGQPVTITGTGFFSGSTVRFGGVVAASVSYTSPTSLTAVVPVGAPAGSSALTVGSYDVASAASPAFEVLQVYRAAAASGCLSTAPLTVDGTGGAGKWRYLRLPGAGGAVVAAIEDTRNLGTVSAQVLALGTGTSAAVRSDGRSRRYLDRNFALTATNKSFAGSSVRVRFFGLSSELARLQAVDAGATAAGLKASQYSGPNENCDLTDNDPAGERRLLAATATTLAGTDWFTAQVSVADHFSEFNLTGASTPLPVELSVFTATAQGPATVRLAWATASEKNSAAFEVERSLDSRMFAPIGTVAAAGNSSTPHRYELLDTKLPASTLLYYRLKQVDQDGTFSYSPVRTVALSGAATGLALYPNPSHGSATTLTGAQPGAVVRVLDALGRQVLTAPADAAGTAVLALPAGLASGVYVVRTGQLALRLTVE